MNPNNGTLIPVLHDADISCNGTTETIYYGQPMPMIYLALWLVGWYDIFSLVGNGGAPVVRMFFEFSVDGVTWRAGTTALFSTNAAGVGPGAQNSTVGEFGPLVRFNVGIVNPIGAVASARLSAVVNARFS